MQKSFQKYISIVKDCVDAKKAFILENIVDVKKLSKVKFCWCWKLLESFLCFWNIFDVKAFWNVLCFQNWKIEEASVYKRI